jgi:hypothetical protein
MAVTSRNTRAAFLQELRAEIDAEGYSFVSLHNRMLCIRTGSTIELREQRRMGEGVNNSFTSAWPPGFEFCGSEQT